MDDVPVEYDVESFKAICTEAPEDEARFYMEAAHGDLQQAINMFAGARVQVIRVSAL